MTTEPTEGTRGSGEGASNNVMSVQKVSLAHKSPLAATITALRDLVRPRRDVALPGLQHRMVGQHVVITGASRGLGRAIATEVGVRGAEVTLTGRKAPDDLAKALSEIEGTQCRAFGAEFSDLDQVLALAKQLTQGPEVHCLILNAGLMARETRLTPQGFEEMFAVHCLANVILVSHLLHAKKLVSTADGVPPRIILVSSETHRSSPPILLESFQVPKHFGMKDGMKWYSHSKLLMLSWLLRVARQTDAKELCVHTLCPGPIASDIAREAPPWLKPVIGPVMRFLFNSPLKACSPVIYFACGPGAQSRSGDYLHMLARKVPDPRAVDEKLAEEISLRLRILLERWLPSDAPP